MNVGTTNPDTTESGLPSVGVASLDQDHEKLLELIHRVQEVIGQKTPEHLSVHQLDRVLQIIDRLAAFSDHHFGNEEQVMIQAGYPGQERHRIEHGIYMTRLYAIREQVRREGALHPADIESILKEWLLGHIRESDLSYADHLKGQRSAA